VRHSCGFGLDVDVDVELTAVFVSCAITAVAPCMIVSALWKSECVKVVALYLLCIVVVSFGDVLSWCIVFVDTLMSH